MNVKIPPQVACVKMLVWKPERSMRNNLRRGRPATRSTGAGGFRQNHGVAGVVYILENPGLARGLHKIGCSRRSDAARAADLNREASTGTPGMFRCVHEIRTRDCGVAEQAVFAELKAFRRGKRGQEYFEVQVEHALEVITRICRNVDSEFSERSAHRATDEPDDSKMAARLRPHTNDRVAPIYIASTPTTPVPVSRTSVDSSAPRNKFGSKVTWAFVLLAGWGLISLFQTHPHSPINIPPAQQPLVSSSEAAPPTAVPSLASNVPLALPQSSDQGGEAAALADLAREPPNASHLHAEESERPSAAEEANRVGRHGGVRGEQIDDSRSQRAAISDLTSEEKQSLEITCAHAKFSGDLRGITIA